MPAVLPLETITLIADRWSKPSRPQLGDVAPLLLEFREHGPGLGKCAARREDADDGLFDGVAHRGASAHVHVPSALDRPRDQRCVLDEPVLDIDLPPRILPAEGRHELRERARGPVRGQLVLADEVGIAPGAAEEERGLTQLCASFCEHAALLEETPEGRDSSACCHHEDGNCRIWRQPKAGGLHENPHSLAGKRGRQEARAHAAEGGLMPATGQLQHAVSKHLHRKRDTAVTHRLRARGGRVVARLETHLRHELQEVGQWHRGQRRETDKEFEQGQALATRELLPARFAGRTGQREQLLALCRVATETSELGDDSPAGLPDNVDIVREHLSQCRRAWEKLVLNGTLARGGHCER
mmetsp:Transcript_5216/g.12838  ORF Transcript_5216/g.12838 Transcript_5216/m.12838 type:complete len:355 (-) Transcript_5216:2836-3900(-)